MLRGKERTKEQIYRVEVNEEDLYTLKINCKGKRTVGMPKNKCIKNIIGLKN